MVQSYNAHWKSKKLTEGDSAYGAISADSAFRIVPKHTIVTSKLQLAPYQKFKITFQPRDMEGDTQDDNECEVSASEFNTLSSLALFLSSIHNLDARVEGDVLFLDSNIPFFLEDEGIPGRGLGIVEALGMCPVEG